MANERKKSQYRHLVNKWTDLHTTVKKAVWDRHTSALNWVLQNVPGKQLAVGSLSGLIIATTPLGGTLSSIPTSFNSSDSAVVQSLNKDQVISNELLAVLPKEVAPLTKEEESKVSEILSAGFGFRVIPEIDGKRLNRSYGYIGQEQHLMRFPGDTVDTHFGTDEEAQKFAKHGLAPGRGAWGYFANSQSEMTQKDIEREKYYIAVPTFLSDDFLSKFGEYRDFFKYRKMLVINAENGKAVVADIGDAGPAVWTGKHLGGSPEVMRHLERVDGAQRGPVLYFFIDDPEDKIPLGPIEI